MEETIVKMKDHPYGDGVQTTAPTCDKTGILPYTCTAKDCGHTKTETIPATGALSMAPVMALLVINSIGAGALIVGKKRFF